ncbi:MAG: HAD family phosphatase [Acidimicrobiia bacterium]
MTDAPMTDAPMTDAGIKLAVIDADGTAISDDDVVLMAFVEALGALGLGPEVAGFDDRMRYVRFSMGRARFDVFQYLLRDAGTARLANRIFEAAVESGIGQSEVAPMPGAQAAIDELRDEGVAVCLVGTMTQRALDRIVAEIGWTDAVDLTLAPNADLRGRPHPDLVLMATMRLGIDSVRDVAVVGGTVASLVAGNRAGAATVVGVAADDHEHTLLGATPHTHLVRSIGEVPGVLRRVARRRTAA